MARECMFALAVAASNLAGCSVLLDFSESQIPADAAADAPYTDEACAYLEPNDSVAAAAAFTTADVGPAAICPPAEPGTEDHDFYRFTVPPPTLGSSVVTVSIAFINRADGDLDLILRDATGTMLAQSRGFGDGETITCPSAVGACSNLPPGDYVFEVFPALAGAVNSYDIALSILEE